MIFSIVLPYQPLHVETVFEWSIFLQIEEIQFSRNNEGWNQSTTKHLIDKVEKMIKHLIIAPQLINTVWWLQNIEITSQLQIKYRTKTTLLSACSLDIEWSRFMPNHTWYYKLGQNSFCLIFCPKLYLYKTFGVKTKGQTLQNYNNRPKIQAGTLSEQS